MANEITLKLNVSGKGRSGMSVNNTLFDIKLQKQNQPGIVIGNDVVKIQGLDGKSAYEIAVSKGYVGTETQWLASLQGKNGTNGTNGQDGQDGISPIAKVTQTATGATITIIDKNGTTSVPVNNGQNGSNGQDGYTPVRGTDYWTSTDKLEIINTVKSEIVIPVVPTEEINANTNARHTHNNKSVLDNISQSKVTEWNNKQNAISDLDTIRSGASLGATALQSVPNTYKTKTENDNLYQSKGNYALESDIPTKTSDLENDSNFVTNTDYGTTSKAGVIKAANGANINSSTGTISVKTYTSDEYNTAGQYIFVGKGTLENVLAAKGYLTEHQDISGKQDKSTLETDVKTFINAEYIQTLFTNAEGVEF